MPIERLLFKTFEARRYQDQPAQNQQIRVDHNSNLSMVRLVDPTHFDVEFAYTTSYGAMGVIKVEGSLRFAGDAAEAAADEWGKTRNLPPQVAQEVHGAILSACVPEAVGLAKGIRMPPPIPLPQVRFDQQAKAPEQPGPDAA